MDKKKFFLSVLCIFILLFSNITVHADEITLPLGLDYLDYLTLESMSLAITEGAELDWSDLDLGSAVLTSEEKAKKMFEYYRAKAWGLEAAGVYGLIDIFGSDSGDPGTAAVGFQIGSGIRSNQASNLKRQLDDLALGISSEPITMDISTYDIAYWSQYGVNYLNTFLTKINSYNDNIIESVVPEEYLYLVDEINGNGFDAFVNLGNPLLRGYTAYKEAVSNVTWAVDNIDGHSIPWGPTDFASTNAALKVYNGILDVYITSSNDIYSATIAWINYNNGNGGQNNYFLSSQSADQDWRYFRNYYVVNGGVGMFCGNFWNIRGYSTWSSRQFSGSLESVLTNISRYVKNINLYVDGVAWSTVGEYSGQNIDKWNVSFPNAVIDSSNEDGKIVAAPIFWVNDENTGNPVDSWSINLDNVYDIIKGKIANNDTSISIQDLIDGDAIEKDGVAIGVGTGAIAGTRSLTDAIVDSRVDAATQELTLTNVLADDVPPLPALPSMGVNPGFQGVTVLARIINVANQSLPSELVTVFWGVIFGAVILGIIKILHK